MYLGDLSSACDAAQEVFYKLLTREVTDVGAERAWLYVTARHQCLNMLRERSRRASALTARARREGVLRRPNSVLSGIVRSEVFERLSDIVANLPPELRIPLFLRYYAGFARSNIAQQLEISEHAVKARLCRALIKLRTHSSLRMT
jgi:RNA polymerase sigma-70 factor (ECF subfamily)